MLESVYELNGETENLGGGKNKFWVFHDPWMPLPIFGVTLKGGWEWGKGNYEHEET